MSKRPEQTFQLEFDFENSRSSTDDICVVTRANVYHSVIYDLNARLLVASAQARRERASAVLKSGGLAR